MAEPMRKVLDSSIRWSNLYYPGRRRSTGLSLLHSTGHLPGLADTVSNGDYFRGGDKIL